MLFRAGGTAGVRGVGIRGQGRPQEVSVRVDPRSHAKGREEHQRRIGFFCVTAQPLAALSHFALAIRCSDKRQRAPGGWAGLQGASAGSIFSDNFLAGCGALLPFRGH